MTTITLTDAELQTLIEGMEDATILRRNRRPGDEEMLSRLEELQRKSKECSCEGLGRVRIPCPDGRLGCCAAHYRRCVCRETVG